MKTSKDIKLAEVAMRAALASVMDDLKPPIPTNVAMSMGAYMALYWATDKLSGRPDPTGIVELLNNFVRIGREKGVNPDADEYFEPSTN